MAKRISHPGEAKSEILKATPEACVDETAAVEFLEKQRWGDTPTCPHCGSIAVVRVMNADGTARNKRFLWRCHDCSKQFTVKVGTIMEDSRIPHKVWCWAFWSACASKKGVSASQISRECNLSYKSALFLMHRIRWAIASKKPGAHDKFTGVVEVDETFVGGKSRNKHANKRGKGKKTPVVAMIEREGRVRARPIANVTAKTLKREIVASITIWVSTSRTRITSTPAKASLPCSSAASTAPSTQSARSTFTDTSVSLSSDGVRATLTTVRGSQRLSRRQTASG